MLHRYRLFALTLMALIAFAGNSVLCRYALAHTAIDPASFTAVRLLAGAATLALLCGGRGGQWWRAGQGKAAGALFVYAAALSWAYQGVATGAGALILFGLVQLTLLTIGAAQGRWPGPAETMGLVLAVAGLLLLLLPGARAPAPASAALMGLSGVAWGLYTHWGAGAGRPLQATAGNFIRTVPMAIGLLLVFSAQWHVSIVGWACALASGALTSAIGYAIWYRALQELRGIQPALVQLAVPVVAASGGVVFVGEPLTARFALAAALVLGGIAFGVIKPFNKR